MDKRDRVLWSIKTHLSAFHDATRYGNQKHGELSSLLIKVAAWLVPFIGIYLFAYEGTVWAFVGLVLILGSVFSGGLHIQSERNFWQAMRKLNKTMYYAWLPALDAPNDKLEEKISNAKAVEGSHEIEASSQSKFLTIQTTLLLLGVIITLADVYFKLFG